MHVQLLGLPRGQEVAHLARRFCLAIHRAELNEGGRGDSSTTGDCPVCFAIAMFDSTVGEADGSVRDEWRVGVATAKIKAAGTLSPDLWKVGGEQESAVGHRLSLPKHHYCCRNCGFLS